MKEINDFINKNKKSIFIGILFFSTLIFIINGVQKQLKEEELNKKLLNKIKPKIEIKLEDVEENIKPFLNKSNILIIENKSDMKIPFIEYHDKMLIDIKKYNKNKNFTLNIVGDIKVEDEQLKEQQLKSNVLNENMKQIFEKMIFFINLKKCKKVSAKNIFVYLNKGVSITYRKKSEFAQFNILDNKIFVWQERLENDKNNKYILCNYNPSNILDKISDLLIELKKIEKND